MKQDSDSDLSQEIHDQLSELWNNAQLKRKAMIDKLTPHSRKPTYQTATNYKSYGGKEKVEGEKSKNYTEKDQSKTKEELSVMQIIRLRQQLSKEAVQSKQKDMQMEMLRRTAQQLSNENKYLTKQLHQTHIHDQNNSKLLNQSSIHPLAKSIQPKKMKSKPKKNNRRVTQMEMNKERNEDTSKQRLAELVRSTSEYRSYVFYYDSNQLSFLKRLQEQHKKTCQRTPAEKQKQFWAPKQLVDQLKLLNVRQSIDMTQSQVEMIVSRLKGYFQARVEKQIQRLKVNLEAKLKQAQRHGQNGVPYQLVQIARARERQLSRWNTKRSASMFK